MAKGQSRASPGQRRRRIGRQGENLARTLLEDLELAPRKEELDDGEDFWIEVERHDARWERIGVQVKASEGFPTKPNAPWQVRLKPNAVARYRQAAHLIVILAVNVNTKAIRWATLPQATSDDAITLTIPPERSLAASDGQAFELALRGVLTAHHAKVHAPSQVMSEQAAYLRALDPDIDVQLVASPEGTTVQLGISLAQTPVEIDGEATVDVDGRWAEACRYGVPATLTWRNARLTGSPLLDALADAPLLSLDIPAHGGDRRIRLGWLNAEGDSHHAFETHGSLYIGSEGALVRLDEPALPLRFEGRWPLDPGPSIDLQFSLHLDPWLGEPFARLPYWDGVLMLVTALVRGDALTIRFCDEGYDSDPLVLGPDDRLRAWAVNCMHFLTPLQTLVAAARHTQSGALLTGDSIGRPSSAVARRFAIASRLLVGEVLAVPPVDWPVAHDADVSDVLEYPAKINLTWEGTLVASLPVEYVLCHYTVIPREGNNGRRLAATTRSETYLRLALR